MFPIPPQFLPPDADLNMSAEEKFYFFFNMFYTLLVLCLLLKVAFNKSNPAVKIRGFKITLAAVLSLHTYLFMLLLVPLLDGKYPCTAEFWVMNTIFPSGIAIFQVTNIRMLLYVRHQASIRDPSLFALRKRSKSVWNLSAIQKVYAVIGFTLIVQFIITVVLFVGSRRFDATYGFFGTKVSETECRKGLEWIPSVIWQCLAAWVAGPVLLWLTRHVHDCQSWAWQLRATIVASLPGTPLWLFFLYGPEVATTLVDGHFKPAMWFAPGIVAMEMALLWTVVLGIGRNVRPPTKDDGLEFKCAGLAPRPSSSSSSKSIKLAGSRKAMRYQLESNFGKLLHFAATKDFTAENVQFLREVKQWKARWTPCLGNSQSIACLNDADKIMMWQEAAMIYFELVDPETSSCNINVEDRVVQDLAQSFPHLIFVAPVPDGKKRSEACPWESPFDLTTPGLNTISSNTELQTLTPAREISMTDAESVSIHTTYSASIYAPPPSSASSSSVTEPTRPVWPSHCNPHRGTIVPTLDAEETYQRSGDVFLVMPSSFSIKIFDIAAEMVEYLVYTNTWKNFVGALSDYEVLALTVEFDTYVAYIEPNNRNSREHDRSDAERHDASCISCHRKAS